MKAKKRRRHSAEFKFRIALEAPEGSRTMSQMSSEHALHANVIRSWKQLLLEGEAALEEKMVTVKQGKAVRQPLRERSGYKQSREEPAD